jgi:glycosyltransferase involved in cell wall biosynthesis
VRLLVVSQYFWPESFRINDLVAEMVSRGHEVTVLTGKPNYPEGDLFPEFVKATAEFSHFAGADIVRLPMLARGKGNFRLALNYLSFALAGAFLSPFLLRGRRFDAIFVCLLSPVTSALPAVVMRWLRRIPSVVWVLDLWPQSLEAVGVLKSKRALALVAHLVGYIYRRSDRILGQSRSFVSEISRYLSDNSRVDYFPSWSETAFAPKDVLPAPEIPVRSDLFNIVFTGNVGDAQDFPSVLAAAESLREDPIRWIIVGDGRKADWVKAEIVRRELEQSVVMVGRFPLDRMASFYAHADALLVSLRADPIFAMTIPAKVQAYLNASRPILAMLDGDGADVVRAADAGYAVPAGDSNGLVEAIRRLAAASPAERARLSQSGLAYSAREFDRATLMTRLEENLIGLASAKSAGR